MTNKWKKWSIELPARSYFILPHITLAEVCNWWCWNSEISGILWLFNYSDRSFGTHHIFTYVRYNYILCLHHLRFSHSLLVCGLNNVRPTWQKFEEKLVSPMLKIHSRSKLGRESRSVFVRVPIWTVSMLLPSQCIEINLRLCLFTKFSPIFETLRTTVASFVLYWRLSQNVKCFEGKVLLTWSQIPWWSICELWKPHESCIISVQPLGVGRNEEFCSQNCDLTHVSC